MWMSLMTLFPGSTLLERKIRWPEPSVGASVSSLTTASPSASFWGKKTSILEQITSQDRSAELVRLQVHSQWPRESEQTISWFQFYKKFPVPFLFQVLCFSFSYLSVTQKQQILHSKMYNDCLKTLNWIYFNLFLELKNSGMSFLLLWIFSTWR